MRQFWKWWWKKLKLDNYAFLCSKKTHFASIDAPYNKGTYQISKQMVINSWRISENCQNAYIMDNLCIIMQDTAISFVRYMLSIMAKGFEKFQNSLYRLNLTLTDASNGIGYCKIWMHTAKGNLGKTNYCAYLYKSIPN